MGSRKIIYIFDPDGPTYATGASFRRIRFQRERTMTTSFTCSTGLGDKLVPLLLPGMFWLLFVWLQRELCVTDDDKWHKSTARSHPITCTVSTRKKDVWAGPFGEETPHPFAAQKLIVKLLSYALHIWNLFFFFFFKSICSTFCTVHLSLLTDTQEPAGPYPRLFTCSSFICALNIFINLTANANQASLDNRLSVAVCPSLFI